MENKINENVTEESMDTSDYPPDSMDEENIEVNFNLSNSDEDCELGRQSLALSGSEDDTNEVNDAKTQCKMKPLLVCPKTDILKPTAKLLNTKFIPNYENYEKQEKLLDKHSMNLNSTEYVNSFEELNIISTIDFTLTYDGNRLVDFPNKKNLDNTTYNPDDDYETIDGQPINEESIAQTSEENVTTSDSESENRKVNTLEFTNLKNVETDDTLNSQNIQSKKLSTIIDSDSEDDINYNQEVVLDKNTTKKVNRLVSSSSSSESDDESEISNIKPNNEEKLEKKADPVALKSISNIKSETQRLYRESEVNIPYHNPKRCSLKEFLARKNQATLKDTNIPNSLDTSLQVKKSNQELINYAKYLKERDIDTEYSLKSREKASSPKSYVSLAIDALLNKDTAILTRMEHQARKVMSKSQNLQSNKIVIISDILIQPPHNPLNKPIDTGTGVLKNVKCTIDGPKLKGDSSLVIDLESDNFESKPKKLTSKSGADELLERFRQTTLKKIPNKNSSPHSSEQHESKVSGNNVDDHFGQTTDKKPGASYVALQKKLKDIISASRKTEIDKKVQNFKADDEMVGKICAEEDDDDNESGSASENENEATKEEIDDDDDEEDEIDHLVNANTYVDDADDELDSGEELSDEEPEITNEKPEITNEEPEITNEKFKVTNEESNISIEESEFSNEGPEISNRADISNKEPKISNKGVEVTNEKSEITNEETEIANEGPKISNEGAEITNEKPEITNEESEILNEGSEISNEGTEISNEEPEITNEKPKITKEKREKTTQTILFFNNNINNQDNSTNEEECPEDDSEQPEHQFLIPTTQIPATIDASQLAALCSGIFEENVIAENVEESNDSDSNDDDDDHEENENDEENERIFEEDTIKTKKIAKIVYSDDEDEDNDEEKNNYLSNTNIEMSSVNNPDESSSDPEMHEGLSNYDSDDNVTEFDLTETDKTANINNEFIDKEAELSESEWGSADEDEKDLDQYDIELGDEDEFDQDKLQAEVGRIHMRKVMDEDARELKKMQDLIFEDAETDGLGRQRQFKWKKLENSLNVTDIDYEKKIDNEQQSGDSNDDDDDEEEEKWRKMKHEREVLLMEKDKEIQLKSTPTLSLLKSNNINWIDTTTENRIETTMESNKQTKEPSTVSAECDSPFLITKTLSSSIRGSFLQRDDESLSRVAASINMAHSSSSTVHLDHNYVALAGNIKLQNITSKDNNFVFTTLSQNPQMKKDNKRRNSNEFDSCDNKAKKAKQEVLPTSTVKTSLIDHLNIE